MQPAIERWQASDLPEEDVAAPDVGMAALLDVAERRPGLRQSVSLARIAHTGTMHQMQQHAANAAD